MYLPCFSPLASTMVGQKLPLHKPSSIRHKPLTKLYSHRLTTSQVPRINMAFITTDDGITRRIGNHHPNLWDDHFIQSLPKAYDTPSYGECAEKLIKEIKGMFNALPLNTSSADDLYKRLSMVDDVERLGIDRHFQNDIKENLDYVYRYWNDMNGIGCGRESLCVDLNTTALGFRILRLHRYGVSSGMFKQFRDKDGQLLYSNNQLNDKELRSILNLFRASLIAFSREQALDDTKVFFTTYLKRVLPYINNTCLSKEIEFNLEYGWHTNVSRLEARTYIDIYGDAKNTKNIFNSKLLELAKLDFNMIQSIQQRELQILSRWWTESSLGKLEFARHRHVEYYFWAAGASVEPKYSAFRIGMAKMSALVTYLDDIYDTFGTFEELKLFTQAIKRWDLASMEGLPEFMKVAFKAFYEGVRDMAREAEKTQGRDTLDYAHKVV